MYDVSWLFLILYFLLAYVWKGGNEYVDPAALADPAARAEAAVARAEALRNTLGGLAVITFWDVLSTYGFWVFMGLAFGVFISKTLLNADNDVRAAREAAKKKKKSGVTPAAASGSRAAPDDDEGIQDVEFTVI